MRLNSWLANLFQQVAGPKLRRGLYHKHRRFSTVSTISESLEARRMLSGQTFIVDVTGDSNVFGHTTLRNAITEANNDVGNQDTITFASNVTGTINLTNGVLPITNAMTITGPGAAVLTISANISSQIFNVNDGSPTVEAVTITGLTMTKVGVGIGVASAIDNFENLTLSNDVITNSTAVNGGAIRNESGATLFSSIDTFSGNTATTNGGAIDNLGNFTTTDDTFTGNTAASTGGAINNSSAVFSTNDTISGNTATNGGGIASSNTFVSTNDTIAGNSGSGVAITGGSWNSLNTIVAGNVIATGSTTPSDAVSSGATVKASSTLIGDANSAAGIVNGTNGNIVGRATNTILVTDANGRPLLANNGGANPTQTIALIPGSPAQGAGAALGTATSAISQSATSIAVNATTFFAVGQLLRIDTEVVSVVAISDATHIVVQRGASPASHLANSPIQLAQDQRGFTRGAIDMGSYAAPRTIVVDILGDVDVAGHTTLRDAITAADIETPGDTVTFANGLTGTITLTQGELPITNAMTISGPGAGVLTVSGNSTSRIFDIASASPSLFNVAISGLTLTLANSNSSSTNAGLGGAIYNAENLTLSNNILTSNSAASGGGGVYNTGILTSSNNALSSNTSTGTGGGIANINVATSTQDTISSNGAQSGGGIYNSGTLTITGSAVTLNTSTNGGGVDNAGVMTSTNNKFNSNAGGEGGGVLNAGTLVSSGDTFSSNTGTDGAGVKDTGTMTSTNNTFSNNSGGNGGGIDVVSVFTSNGDTFSGNLANFGGGIYNTGTTFSTNDTIANNLVSTAGAGAYSTGTLTTTNDTIAGNTVGGVDVAAGIWNSLNTIVAGNLSAIGSATFSDVVVTGSGAVNASFDLIGDANSSGGISNGLQGNIVGKPVSAIFVTDVFGNPALSNNGGPTQTIALLKSSVADGAGTSVAISTGAVVNSTSPTQIAVSSSKFIAAGDLLLIDSEIVLVTAVTDGTHITVQRAADGTTPAAHSANTSITMAVDQRGFGRKANDIGSFGAAQSIIVDITGDTDVAGHTTLRDAITQANADQPGDTIVFAPSVTGTITLSQGVLTIKNSMSIIGPGAGVLTVSGNHLSEIFSVTDGAATTQFVTINGLTIAQGAAGAGVGGAFDNSENLTLSNDVFSGNSASSGGAITNEKTGILNSTGNTFSGNIATVASGAFGGGAISNIAAGVVTSTGDTFTGNTAIGHAAGTGGAILNAGAMTITNDTFSANQADTGGAIENAGTLTSNSDSIAGNTAGLLGGGLDNPGTLLSFGDTFSSNSAPAGGGGVNNPGTATLTNDTFSGNSSQTGLGGGVASKGTLFTVSNTIAGNAGSGVEISGGAWTSFDTIVAGNTSASGSPSDVATTGGTIVATFTLIGDAGSAGGITTNIFNGNIIGKATNTIFVTSGGVPLLAANGGPTKTIALIAGSPAVATGGAITTPTSPIAQSNISTSIVVAASAGIVPGDLLRIDNEIVLVTAVPDATHIVVNRGQLGTSPTSHQANATIAIGVDQRGYARGLIDIGSYAIVRTIVVTIGGDTDRAGFTTLRDAVTEADIEQPGDTITFASNVTGTITLTQGEIPISNVMTITGPGANVLTVSGNNNSRIFDINSPSVTKFAVTITGLKFTRGNSASSTSNPGIGGALYNAENLTLSSDTFTLNTASSGGAIGNAGSLTITGDTFSTNTGTNGGGLFNQGTINSTRNTYTGNSATTDGGGIYNAGTLTSSNDTFSGNTGTVSGGGIANIGTATVTSDTFTANSSPEGAGLYNDGVLTSFGSTYNGNTSTNVGGGFFNDGTMTSTNDTIARNSANNAGGGIFNNNILLTVNDTIAGNTGTGLTNESTWTSLNTIVAGNRLPTGSTPSDVVNLAGTINASFTLIGDAASSGGITNGVNGNIVGKATNTIFVTDVSGIPLLANNGGPTQTIALLVIGPAIGKGTSLTSVAATIPSSGTLTTIQVNSTANIAIGDQLRIDNEIMIVTAIGDATHVTVQRAQHGSAPAAHAVNALVQLGTDERNFVRGVNDLGAYAAPRTIIVTIGGDAEVANFTTLRDAVNEADIESPGDTVTFAANVVGTIVLTQGELAVTNAYTITGPGAPILTVSGNNNTRIFDISSTAPTTFNVNITGLTLSHGNSTSSVNHTGLGGAIYNAGNLSLSSVVLSSNTGVTGGAIDNAGSLTSSNDTFSTNSATSGGGLANSGNATTTSDTFSGNTATSGGALYNTSTLGVSQDQITGNHAVNGAGAYNASPGTLTMSTNNFTTNTAFTATGGSGGGVDNAAGGVAQSTNDTFTGNTATGSGTNSSSGGAITNAGTFTISGDTIAGSAATSGAAIENSGGLTSQNTIIKNNSATLKGGGLDNSGTVNSNGDSFTNNFATSGGGIFNSGTLTSTFDLLSGNSATSGGGLNNAQTATLSQDTISGNTAASGAGAYNQATGTLTTTGNLFSSNVAQSAQGGSGGGIDNLAQGVVNSSSDTFSNNSAIGNNNGSGGGLLNAGTMTLTTDIVSSNIAASGGGVDNPGTLISLNTTFSGNSASANGGGIANGGAGQVGSLSSSYDTYSGNAAVDGGGIYTSGGTVKLVNDTIAENTATEGAGVFNHVGTVNTLNVTIADNSANVAGGLAGGFANDGAATWNTINTIIAGNHQGSTPVPSDFVAVTFGGTVTARNTLFGDASTANGLQGGVNGNIVGRSTTSIFVTDNNGIPVLANNGGPTQTIALQSGGPAVAQGTTIVTTTTSLIAATGAQATIQVLSTASIAVGDYLKIDSEVFRVISVINSTNFVAARAQKGTSTAIHTTGTPVALGDDERGFGRSVNDIGSFAPSRRIIVDISGDTETAGHTTLRDAVTQADADPSGDIITFGPRVLGTIILTQGEIPITNSMTIVGGGASLVGVSPHGSSRIFDINSTSSIAVTISGLTFSGGNSNASSIQTGLGGAIFNSETLTLSNDVFNLNTANSGGAIDNVGTIISSNNSFTSNSATSGNGGGILNTGTLSSTNDTFTGNSSTGGGGGIYGNGQVTVASDVFSGNSAAVGGGIDNQGTWTSSNTTFDSNSATGNGGGIANSGTLVSIGDAILNNSASNGGGAFNSNKLTMTNDTIALNSATNGGGIDNTLTFNSINVTIAGNSGSGIDNLGTWNSFNTLVIGNWLTAGSSTPSDVVNSGTINAWSTLIGDLNSAGGITNGVNGNIVGAALNTVLATDANGKPLLANNGGPTKTIAMFGNAPGANQGAALATSVSAITQTTSPTTITVSSSQFIVAGDLLRIDNEIVLVTAVTDSTHITVQRGQNGTTAVTHLAGVPMILGIDERGSVRRISGIGAFAAPRTITVDVLGDAEVAGHTTLRDAVTMANSEGPGDSIVFALGLTGTIALTQGELLLLNPITITGPGTGVITISGSHTSRIFYIGTSATKTNVVTISGLTLSQGNSNSNSDNPGLGGAIFNDVNLTLFNDLFTGNTAQAVGPGGGGAVFNNGTLSSTNDQFVGNLAKDGGAIFNNSGMITSTTDKFLQNTATNTGGAIGNSAGLVMTSDVFSNNSASVGGAINNTNNMIAIGDTYSGNSAASIGGAIANDGTAISTNETFFGNSGSAGSGVFNEAGSLTTVNDSIANNTGNGVYVSQGVWNSLNTIVAGNLISPGSTTLSDVVKSGGTINAQDTLIGDAGSAGGIVNGTNGNIVGKATNTIFVTDSSGHPLLANNGGPTQTILLAAGSPANGKGGPLATATVAIPLSVAPTTILVNSSTFFAIGDLVKVDNEIFLISAILDATHIVAQRAQQGTTAAAHLANAPINLSTDQTGSARVNFDLGSHVAVNHAPSGTTGTIATNTNVAYTFKVSDFGFTDSDTPPNSLLNVLFTLLPNAGIISDNGVPITLNQFVSASDISAGKLVFTPSTNLVGGPYFVCKFQVQDNGGTVNGGADLDPVAKILYIKIANFNHAPVGTANTITVLENTGYSFKISDFGFTDPNDSPANSLLAVKMTTLPAKGTLTDNGVTLLAGASVPVSDISAGLLKFNPVTNAVGSPYANFTFQVQDNGGTLNNGVDTDPTPRAMTISVVNVNHAPTGTQNTVSATVNTPYTLKIADFGFSDPNDTPPNTLLAVKITLLPNAGTFTDNGVAVTVNQSISAADISSGKLIFTPLANLAGGPYFLCRFQVQDNGGTANGGVDLDPNPKVLYVKLTP